MTSGRGRASSEGKSRALPALPALTALPTLIDWQVMSAPPGSIADPGSLPASGWLVASGPTTAAGALRAAGLWSLDQPARRFDAEDWWWRARSAPQEVRRVEDESSANVLCCDGLATLVDVWWNGVHILRSDNMFLSHVVPIDSAAGELVLCCRALDAALARKKPRPRWRAPMIEHQQLRFVRTTLLGRTPGWSPPAAVVGPWRSVRIEQRRDRGIEDVRLTASVDRGRGVLDVSCRAPAEPTPVMVVRRDGLEARVALDRSSEERWTGQLLVPEVALWWPHTHGEPACYRGHLEAGAHHVDLGPIGFRTIALDTADGGFALSVNGVKVFCRGACFTPLDPVTLDATPAAYDGAVAQAAAAGMNMLRVGGTMVYEPNAFHDACDAHGVLVWQDLMFANMDYPDEDPAFLDSVGRELDQELSRLGGHPSVAVICGGSEVEQQAAMWGADRARWSPPLSTQIFPPLVAALLPGVPYWPSSAHGGAFPHAADQGTTSYYGVGAYLRPLDDARRAGVRFATECLAFANVPAEMTPATRARTPRDLGASWDFDDVRDHYVERLFGVDAALLRRTDFERYADLSRVATGEVMADVFSEWRRPRSTCRGGLVWFLRDLWASAGWGLVDASGAPKAAYHFLRRALAPIAIGITDEGGNGLALHVNNDGPQPVQGELILSTWRGGEVLVNTASRDVVVPAHGGIEHNAIEFFDHFVDASYAYRFGPPPFDLVQARLVGEDQTERAEAFFFPVGRPAAREFDVGLSATAHVDGRARRLTVHSRRFAQAVSIAVPHHLPHDNFFHVAPGCSRTVALVPVGDAPFTGGSVTALNAEVPAKIRSAA